MDKVIEIERKVGKILEWGEIVKKSIKKNFTF